MTEAASVSERAPTKRRFEFPNFDYIRLAAAALVIFSHSFTIAQGTDANEPLVRLIGEENILGIYAVCVFFIISGFLITMSAYNSRSILEYAAARILRIYPALIVCQVLTALILGAMFSSVGAIEYIRRLDWLRYAYYHSIWDIANAWEIPTVRFYQDAQGTGEGLNGSLWSIQQELVCYLIIGILYITRTLRWPAIVLVCILSYRYLMPWSRNDAEPLAELINWSISDERLYDYLWVGPSFFTGALIFFFWQRYQRLPAWPNALAAAAFGWALYRGHYYDLFPIYFAYPLLYFATATQRTLPSLKRFGDISYGVYLYGWPMQQLVRGWWGDGITWWQLFVLSLAASVAAGYASWHLLEKPMLSLKRWFRREREPKLATQSIQATVEAG